MNVAGVSVQTSFTSVAASWQEQRRYTDFAIEALGNHSVVADIKAELGRISPQWPDLRGELPVSFLFRTCILNVMM